MVKVMLSQPLKGARLELPLFNEASIQRPPLRNRCKVNGQAVVCMSRSWLMGMDWNHALRFVSYVQILYSSRPFIRVYEASYRGTRVLEEQKARLVM
jgi:hypothetical protein